MENPYAFHGYAEGVRSQTFDYFNKYFESEDEDAQFKALMGAEAFFRQIYGDDYDLEFARQIIWETYLQWFVKEWNK